LHRGEGQAAIGMEVFHPFHQHSATPRGLPITADNVAAIGHMFAKTKG